MDSYAALRKEFRRRGFYEKATGRIVAELAWHIGCIAAGFALFMVVDHWVVRGVALVLAAVGSLGVSTNCHTSSHYATSSKKWVNELLTLIGYPFINQVSATYWWHKHVIGHHPAPNVIGQDGDIDLLPWFAYTQEDVDKSRGLWRLYYKIQWLVLPLALGIMAIEVQIYGWCHLLARMKDPKQRRASHWADLGMLLLHWAVWYALPMAFFSVPDVLIFNFGRVMLGGYAMFAAFAPAHFPAEAVALTGSESKGDYILLQTATTVNFRTGFFGRLLCSGVDYQIEHHLFPGISHVYYPLISPIVREFCRRHGYPYRTLGWGEALTKAFLAFISPKKTETRLEALRLPTAPFTDSARTCLPAALRRQAMVHSTPRSRVAAPAFPRLRRDTIRLRAGALSG